MCHNNDRKKLGMKCKESHKSIIFLIENDLSQEKESMLRVHLQQCPACNKLYKEISATYSIINTEKEVDVNPFFYTRLEHKLENVSIKKNIAVFGNATRKTALGFSMAIGILLGVFLGEGVINKIHLNKETSISEDIQTNDEEEYLAEADEDDYNSYNF